MATRPTTKSIRLECLACGDSLGVVEPYLVADLDRDVVRRMLLLRPPIVRPVGPDGIYMVVANCELLVWLRAQTGNESTIAVTCLVLAEDDPWSDNDWQTLGAVGIDLAIGKLTVRDSRVALPKLRRTRAASLARPASKVKKAAILTRHPAKVKASRPPKDSDTLKPPEDWQAGNLADGASENVKAQLSEDACAASQAES